MKQGTLQSDRETEASGSTEKQHTTHDDTTPGCTSRFVPVLSLPNQPKLKTPCSIRTRFDYIGTSHHIREHLIIASTHRLTCMCVTPVVCLTAL